MAATGAPPIGVSWDGSLSNALVQKAFCGFLMEADMADFPFFCDVMVRSPKLPFWTAGNLFYKQEPIFGNIDSLHTLKRLSLNGASRAMHYMHMGAVRVCTLAHLRLSGLPARAYICRDPMSDKEAAEPARNRIRSHRSHQHEIQHHLVGICFF